MVKTSVLKENWRDYAVAYERNGKTYYYINVLPREDGEFIVFLQDIINHEPTEEDKKDLISRYRALCQNALLYQIEQYDKSDAVNALTINGAKTWFDKATRVGLINSIEIEGKFGKTDTTIYYGSNSITLPISQALDMLNKLELYAIAVYRQTEAHKANVLSLENPNDIECYDYTSGYPEQLEFNFTDAH